MNDYSALVSEHARIAILRFLEDAPRYTSNVSMLASALPRLGISHTRDQVVSEITWLQEQGLVETETSGDFMIATATTRGVEVAQGIVKHPGIQRPRAGI